MLLEDPNSFSCDLLDCLNSLITSHKQRQVHKLLHNCQFSTLYIVDLFHSLEMWLGASIFLEPIPHPDTQLNLVLSVQEVGGDKWHLYFLQLKKELSQMANQCDLSLEDLK